MKVIYLFDIFNLYQNKFSSADQNEINSFNIKRNIYSRDNSNSRQVKIFNPRSYVEFNHPSKESCTIYNVLNKRKKEL